jgi:ferric-dicitrate binding protein FerR (iron transport regulator)
MSEREEVQQVSAALDKVRQAYDDIDSLNNQVQSLQLSLSAGQAERDLISKECARWKRRAELYQLAFTALKSKMGAAVAVMDEAIKATELELYGNRSSDRERRVTNGTDSVPKFLTGAPRLN